MDPVTHALLGAATACVSTTGFGGGAAARSTSPPSLRLLMIAGAAAAMLPDLDRLVHSAADPLLHIELHRHFTHALAFIPIGGLIAAAPWMASRRARAHWRAYLLAATAGYATHGLLDACTTYGTLLLWPFSEQRVAWNWISIIDPVFTVALLIGGGVAFWRASHVHPRERERVQGLPVGARAAAATALLLCGLYLAAGALQHARALDAQVRLAAGRAHAPTRGEVFPGFATNVVWRSLYEAEGRLYMDRIRVPWFGARSWSPGASVVSLTEADLAPAILTDARMRADFRRFRWFSSGWVASHPDRRAFIGDARYSLSTDRFDPVWGIRFRPSEEPPVEWVDYSRGRRVDPHALWAEIVGRDPTYGPLP